MPPEPSFYLGPTSDRWCPKDWDDVVHAAADGLLDESSWVELKAGVPAANPASNLETARDLASLTLDGGLYLVGVRDDKGRAGEVVGVEEVGKLSDRLVQLAATRLAPPLAVRPLVIRNPTDHTRGCLAVAVPASAEAPHMVDNKYWGRSPDGKRPLHDPEIRRLHEARTFRERSFDHDLVGLSETFDQVPPQHRQAGHAFLLARPLASVGELPDELVAAWPQMASHAMHIPYADWEGLAGASGRLHHPDGPAATSVPANIDPSTEELVHAVLIRDRGHVGEIQAFSGAGTFPQPDKPPVVSSMVMVQLAQQILMLADYVGRAQLRSESGWQVGLHVTGLAGAVATTPTVGTPRFPHEAFTHSLTASSAELAERSPELTKRLVAPLMRGLGTSWRLDHYTGLDSIRLLRD